MNRFPSQRTVSSVGRQALLPDVEEQRGMFVVHVTRIIQGEWREQQALPC